jgi:hypothetical protein
LVFTSLRENPLLKNSYALMAPLASIAARARWIEAGPFGSQPVPCSRVYCTRTGRPIAFASTAASMAASSASLRP